MNRMFHFPKTVSAINLGVAYNAVDLSNIEKSEMTEIHRIASNNIETIMKMQENLGRKSVKEWIRLAKLGKLEFPEPKTPSHSTVSVIDSKVRIS